MRASPTTGARSPRSPHSGQAHATASVPHQPQAGGVVAEGMASGPWHAPHRAGVRHADAGERGGVARARCLDEHGSRCQRVPDEPVCLARQPRRPRERVAVQAVLVGAGDLDPGPAAELAALERRAAAPSRCGAAAGPPRCGRSRRPASPSPRARPGSAAPRGRAGRARAARRAGRRRRPRSRAAPGRGPVRTPPPGCPRPRGGSPGRPPGTRGSASTVPRQPSGRRAGRRRGPSAAPRRRGRRRHGRARPTSEPRPPASVTAAACATRVGQSVPGAAAHTARGLPPSARCRR